jgi:hypothetical protein
MERRSQSAVATSFCRRSPERRIQETQPPGADRALPLWIETKTPVHETAASGSDEFKRICKPAAPYFPQLSDSAVQFNSSVSVVAAETRFGLGLGVIATTTDTLLNVRNRSAGQRSISTGT